MGLSLLLQTHLEHCVRHYADHQHDEKYQNFWIFTKKTVRRERDAHAKKAERQQRCRNLYDVIDVCQCD